MKRFVFAAMFMLAASSARAELYTGAEPLGVGDPGVPQGYQWGNGLNIDGGNGYAYVQGEFVSNYRLHFESGWATIYSGQYAGTYLLVPGGPQTFLSPSGCFVADNTVDYSSQEYFDQYGLLFSNGFTTHPVEINVFAPASPGAWWNTTLFSSDYTTSFDHATATPEPSSMAIAGVALAFVFAFGALCRRYA